MAGKAQTAGGLLAAGLLLALAAEPSRAAGPDPMDPRNAEIARVLDDMVKLLSVPELGWADWARTSYLATRFFSFGRPAVPILRDRFAAAQSPEEAFLAGLYVAVYGRAGDHRRIRRELEESALKRQWLRVIVGDGRALQAAVRDGASWKPAVQLIPSLSGCRRLTRLCIESGDALVRRAGLYWGFWISDAEYWKLVGDRAGRDPDPLTRQFAAFLEAQRPESERPAWLPRF